MSYKIRSGSKAAKAMVLEEEGYTYSSTDFKWKKGGFQSTVRIDSKSHEIQDQLLVTWYLKRERKDRKDRERIVEKSRNLVESKSRMKSDMKKGGKNMFN